VTEGSIGDMMNNERDKFKMMQQKPQDLFISMTAMPSGRSLRLEREGAEFVKAREETEKVVTHL
jgi:hypothetical protein